MITSKTVESMVNTVLEDMCTGIDDFISEVLVLKFAESGDRCTRIVHEVILNQGWTMDQFTASMRYRGFSIEIERGYRDEIIVVVGY